MNRTLFLCLILATANTNARSQSIFDRTDTQREIELGRELYDSMLRSGLVSKNEAYVNRVNRILKALTDAMPQKLYPYQAVVIAKSEVNAWCAPGGYMCIYEGLISQLPNDDALASVLGHELGHAALRHTARAMRKAQTDIFLGILLRNQNYADLKQRANSRAHEREADAFGVEIYLRAGFDPVRVTSGMTTLDRLHPDDPDYPYYLLTHPPHNERIEAMERMRSRLIAAGLKPVVTDAPPTVKDTDVFGVLPKVEIEGNDRYPLTPGMEWEYEVRGAGSASRYTQRVLGAAKTSNGTIARMRLDIGTSRVEYQVLTTSDSVWRRNRPESARSNWIQEFAMPSAEAVSQTSGERKFTWLGKEDLETPIGRLSNVLKFGLTEPDRSFELWFAKDIGLVKRVNTRTGTEEVLVRFKRP